MLAVNYNTLNLFNLYQYLWLKRAGLSDRGRNVKQLNATLGIWECFPDILNLNCSDREHVRKICIHFSWEIQLPEGPIIDLVQINGGAQDAFYMRELLHTRTGRM